MAVVRQNYGSSVVEFKPHPHVFFTLITQTLILILILILHRCHAKETPFCSLKVGTEIRIN